MLPHLFAGAAAGVTVVFFASEWKGKDLLQYVPIYNRHRFHTQPGAGQVLDIFMSYRVLYCNLSNKKTAIWAFYIAILNSFVALVHMLIKERVSRNLGLKGGGGKGQIRR